MDSGWIILIVPVIAVLAVMNAFRRFGRAEKMLHSWAARNRYRIISAERRWLRRGAFFWFTSDNQLVYRITVVDEHGQTQSGYARVGGWFLGLLSDNIEVSWDRHRGA